MVMKLDMSPVAKKRFTWLLDEMEANGPMSEKLLPVIAVLQESMKDLMPRLVEEIKKEPGVAESMLQEKVKAAAGRRLFIEIVGIDGGSISVIIKFVGPPKNVEISMGPVEPGMCGYRIKYKAFIEMQRDLLEDGQVFTLPLILYGDMRIYGGEDMLALGEVIGSVQYIAGKIAGPMERASVTEALEKALAKALP